VSTPQTWHYGLIAKWWAEFNDDFRPHEIPYFQRYVERGQPALDVACGTGRLLLPYLRAGLDVDGCDVSADMVEVCRQKAAGEGLSPTLFVQPMHELDAPRSYRTIFVCGAFGLGSNREQDEEALQPAGGRGGVHGRSSLFGPKPIRLPKLFRERSTRRAKRGRRKGWGGARVGSAAAERQVVKVPAPGAGRPRRRAPRRAG